MFWSHRGEGCTFDTMVEEFGLRSSDALARLAPIVRGADTARLDLAPQAAGLLAASLGFSRMFRDDLAQLEAGHGALRRLLPLEPRRGRGDPQLAGDAAVPAGGRSRHERRRGRGGRPANPARPPSPRARFPSFGEALRVWLKIGLLSFGGPAGQIALLHREVVDERRWVSDARFLHALNFCTLLPGPEAQQLATYLGWLLHGVRGGVAAGRCSCCRAWR